MALGLVTALLLVVIALVFLISTGYTTSKFKDCIHLFECLSEVNDAAGDRFTDIEKRLKEIEEAIEEAEGG